MANNTPRNKLSKVIPYQTTIRWPSQQNLADVPLDYLSNMVDLSYFLKSSLTKNKPSKSHGSLCDILNDTNNFVEWLLKCHRIACLGADGNHLYIGQSKANRNPSFFAGVLRGPDSMIEVTLYNSMLKSIFRFANRYGDPLAREYSDFELWDRDRKNNEVIRIMQMPGIEEKGIVEGLRSNLSEKSIFDAEKSIPELCSCVFYSPKNCDDAKYYFPSYQFIPQYLESMHSQIRQIFEHINICDLNATLTSLATYYQTGIRSLAVRGIWNSVLMGQVNEILEVVGMKRVPHLNIDYLALCLENNTFKKLFPELIFDINNRGKEVETLIIKQAY